MPSEGNAGFCLRPAAARSVGSQSMEMATCGVVEPGRMWPGQRMIAGTRMPPSRSSALRPEKGQLSEKRSPPLSLVKTTRVLCARFCPQGR